MNSEAIRKWQGRAAWCIAQADAIQRTLPPRHESQPKTMDELSVSFLRGLASNITKKED